MGQMKGNVTVQKKYPKNHLLGLSMFQNKLITTLLPPLLVLTLLLGIFFHEGGLKTKPLIPLGYCFIFLKTAFSSRLQNLIVRLNLFTPQRKILR